MSNPLVVRPTVRKRLREGPLGSSLDALASSLHAQGYTANTISEYLFAGNRFSRWLTQQQIALSEVNETTVARYVRQCGRLPSGRLPKAARGLHHIVTLLREQGVAPLLTAPVLLTEQGQWLSRYEHYLRTVRGVAESTCDVYLRLAQRFLTSCFPTDRSCTLSVRINWMSLSVADKVS